MSYLNRVRSVYAANALNPNVDLIITKFKNNEFDKNLSALLLEGFGGWGGNGIFSKAEKEKVCSFLSRNPVIYGRYISEAERKKLGFYENDFKPRVSITKKVLENVSDIYIIWSILHDSVYNNNKKISKDAITYAWERTKNPINVLKSWNFAGLTSEAFKSTNPIIEKKIKKWIKELSPRLQKKIKKDAYPLVVDRDKELVDKFEKLFS